MIGSALKFFLGISSLSLAMYIKRSNILLNFLFCVFVAYSSINSSTELISANLGAMLAVKQQTFLEFTFTLASCGAPKSEKTDTFDFDREKFRLRP